MQIRTFAGDSSSAQIAQLCVRHSHHRINPVSDENGDSARTKDAAARTKAGLQRLGAARAAAMVISESGETYIGDGGGTSASTPFWAGIIALADQYAGYSLGFVNPALYAIARGPCYHAAFHDITQGSNTVEFPPQTFRGYSAAPGWDPVTGLGSPDAQVLIPLLAHHGC
jgi:hypothetical protein